MVAWLQGIGFAGLLLAFGLSVHGGHRPAEIHAQCLINSSVALVAGVAQDSWRSAVKRANVVATQSNAIAIWGFSRVRLVFPNGGWIEFQPSNAAIAGDAMPPLSAIQFAGPTVAPSHACP